MRRENGYRKRPLMPSWCIKGQSIGEIDLLQIILHMRHPEYFQKMQSALRTGLSECFDQFSQLRHMLVNLQY